MKETERYKPAANQFGAVAENYLSSSGHADPIALDSLVQLVAPQKSDNLLDIATGAGHLSIAFASYVQKVIALDITPSMLDVVAKTASEKGLSHVSTALAPAEVLPFADSSFQIVACRYAAHHFPDIAQSLSEMARVLAPGGKLLIVDTISPQNPTADTEFNEIEKLRDPSHIRNYSAEEWREMIENAGLKISSLETGWYAGGKPEKFTDWTQRIGTPLENIWELQNRFANGSLELKEALKITIENGEIEFCVPNIALLARKDFIGT